jgi:non-homologous end joining protein Ku
MPTAVITGTLSCGLVAVPVRLIPATEPKDV